jgi:hypothetical protein
MPKKKSVDVRGTRYTVRGLTFEELVKLGSTGAKEKESKAVVAEVLSRCLIEPKLGHDQIANLSNKRLVALVSEVLDITKSGMTDRGLVPMPLTRAHPET